MKHILAGECLQFVEIAHRTFTPRSAEDAPVQTTREANARTPLASGHGAGGRARTRAVLKREAKRLKVDGTRGRRRPSERRASVTWLWALQARVTHRAARVQSAIQSAGTVYRLGGLHDVRIELKKLRYAAELGAEAQQTRSTTSIATFKSAHDLLGRLHDLEVLIERVRHAQVSLSPLDLTTWRKLASLTRTVEGDCRVMHARYLQQRSKLIAIVDRLGAQPGRGSRPVVSRIAAPNSHGATSQDEPAAPEIPRSPYQKLDLNRETLQQLQQERTFQPAQPQ